MRRLLRVSLLVPVLMTLPGCGDQQDPQVDFGGDELGPDRHAMTSRDGDVKMGLTDDFVYFTLSDSVVAEARSDMQADAEEEGAQGFFGSLVEKTVGKALGFRARLSVDEVADIRWEGGEMRIDFEDPDRRLSNHFEVNDRPVSEAFLEDDVRAFSEAFRRVKSER